MLVRKVLQTGAIYLPWPVSVDDTPFSGSRFDFSPVCNPDCLNGKGKFYCSHGLAYVQRNIDKENVVVCGYIDDWSKIKKEHRHRLENRSARDKNVYEWLEKLQKLKSVVSSNSTDAVTLGALHEVSRWARQVNVIAHKIVVRDKDLDFTANFEAATKEMKSLYKASSMLVDAFDYLDIFYNPSSAAFGKRRPVDLYKLVDKIRLILLGAEGASQNKKIFITGSLRQEVDLYESFKIIPFCLLQNAIKYSFNSDIIINFSSNIREVEMSVESAGPPISEEEKKKIFEQSYRGKHSKTMHHEGSGMGLYIAKIVADAHALEIKVRSQSCGYQREGIEVHQNVFSLKIPLGAPIERRSNSRSSV